MRQELAEALTTIRSSLESVGDIVLRESAKDTDALNELVSMLVRIRRAAEDIETEAWQLIILRTGK